MANSAHPTLISASHTTSDGAVLPYTISGSSAPNAPLIVLSNPLLVTPSIWNPFLDSFFANPENHGYRILTYVTRGRTSQYGTKPITLDVLAADLRELLDAVNVAKAAAVIGVSIGGATVLKFGMKYPDRVERLVCGSIFANNPPGTPPLWRERVAVGRKQGISSDSGENLVGEDLAEMSVRRWFVPESFESPVVQRRIADVKEVVKMSNLDGFERVVNALFDVDLRQEMKRSPVKASFVVGSEDGFLPKTMKEMAAGFGQGARYDVIDGVGHFPMVEEPDKFASIVTGFLSSA